MDSASTSSTKSAKIANKVRDVIGAGTLPLSVQFAHLAPDNLSDFAPITDEDAIQAIRSTQCKTSPMDYIPTTVLKGAADVFGHIIANLTNLSFSEGVFPSSFKVGQVTPVLKKPDASTEDMANFRPITNLNTIGNILKRLAMKQMRSHMGNSSNLGSKQSAYRDLHSTETAMTRVVSDLLTATDSRSPSVLLSLDISAAFNTLDYRRLLERAKDLFGFDCVILRWLASYLAGREQFVVAGGCRSRTVKLSFLFHRAQFSDRSCFPSLLQRSAASSRRSGYATINSPMTSSCTRSSTRSLLPDYDPLLLCRRSNRMTH